MTGWHAGRPIRGSARGTLHREGARSRRIIMLSQATGYACSAMACVAAMGGKPALVKVVAEACGTPHAYLAKVIHGLAQQGLVRTQRGVGGGVTLARAPAEISLYDVCVALGDPIIQPRCILGNAACTEDRACPAHAFCTRNRAEVSEFLRTTTIADIAAFETRRRWSAMAEGTARK